MSELHTTPEQREELRARFSRKGLAREFHEVYQVEAKRQGDVRHHDDFDDLASNIQEFDYALADYLLPVMLALLADAELAAELESKLWLMQYDKLHHPDEGAIR